MLVNGRLLRLQQARSPMAAGLASLTRVRRGPRARSGTQSALSGEPLRKQENRDAIGVPDGETRTRTGDTTIFSRYVLDAVRRAIPGKTSGSGATRARR
jgi:hypothetical protein